MESRPLKIHIFHCTNSLDPAELASCLSQIKGDDLKLTGLPCSGKVDLLYLIKAFETGADGVLLVTCPQGECRFLEGNLRAVKRAEAVDDLLEEIGQGRGHMEVIQLGENGTEQLIREVKKIRNRIASLPQS